MGRKGFSAVSKFPGLPETWFPGFQIFKVSGNWFPEVSGFLESFQVFKVSGNLVSKGFQIFGNLVSRFTGLQVSRFPET